MRGLGSRGYVKISLLRSTVKAHVKHTPEDNNGTRCVSNKHTRHYKYHKMETTLLMKLVISSRSEGGQIILSK